jgi:DNA polymerase
VLPDGPVPARLAFIGEEPGQKEERVGRGFVGPSGQLLWNSFGPACGFTREEVWVTNACLCRAERVRLENGATLGRDEVQKLAAVCCSFRLASELVAVDPVVLVPLGNVALRQLTQIQQAGIYAYRGSRLEVNLPALAERLQRELAAQQQAVYR